MVTMAVWDLCNMCNIQHEHIGPYDPEGNC